MTDEERVELITKIANNFGISCDDASYIIKSFENFGKEFMMSEADKLFKDLGYEKIEESETIFKYKKNNKTIEIGCPDNVGNPVIFAYMNSQNILYARGITMQELQAIIAKCKELRWIE